MRVRTTEAQDKVLGWSYLVQEEVVGAARVAILSGVRAHHAAGNLHRHLVLRQVGIHVVELGDDIVVGLRCSFPG